MGIITYREAEAFSREDLLRMIGEREVAISHWHCVARDAHDKHDKLRLKFDNFLVEVSKIDHPEAQALLLDGKLF